jgi:hypothetical protein
MILNKTEKEQRVIQLYEQGKTIREIAHEVHMSFADIGSIIRKVTGLQDDNNKPKEQDKIPLAALSKDTQAFALFSEGKKPTEVAIELDLGADSVDRLYQQFWKLEGLYQLNTLYKEIRRYLPSFLTLFKLMKQEKMMSEKDVVDALKFGKELPHLKEQFLLLVEGALQNQITAAKGSLKIYQSAIDDKIQGNDSKQLCRPTSLIQLRCENVSVNGSWQSLISPFILIFLNEF